MPGHRDQLCPVNDALRFKFRPDSESTTLRASATGTHARRHNLKRSRVKLNLLFASLSPPAFLVSLLQYVVDADGRPA
eukprot:426992-Rhodomonas_salina.1